MGRNRCTPASITAFSSGIPSPRFNSMKSTRIMELRTTIPAPAIIPIMEVAVKNTPPSQCAGKMPIKVRGIGSMMIQGVLNDWNHPTTSA